MTEHIVHSAIVAPRNPPLPIPREPHAAVWRYLNFAKFMWLLEAGALFLPYTELFSDVLEGGKRRRVRDDDRARRAAVSSWHASDHESEAMWRIYSPPQEALAIRSTYERLRDGLPDYVRIHLVQYADSPPTSDDPLLPFFFKRKAYEHEKELRAVVGRPPPDSDAIEEDNGWQLPVDVGRVIERVYVSPFSQQWFYELVQGVIRRYGLSIPVERSELTGTVQR